MKRIRKLKFKPNIINKIVKIRKFNFKRIEAVRKIKKSYFKERNRKIKY